MKFFNVLYLVLLTIQVAFIVKAQEPVQYEAAQVITLEQVASMLHGDDIQILPRTHHKSEELHYVWKNNHAILPSRLGTQLLLHFFNYLKR